MRSAKGCAFKVVAILCLASPMAFVLGWLSLPAKQPGDRPLRHVASRPALVNEGMEDTKENLFDRFTNDFAKPSLRKVLNAYVSIDQGGQFSASLGKPNDTGFVMEAGNIFERATVHFGELSGPLPPEMLQMSSTCAENCGATEFKAASISSVVHPKNPHHAIMHFNYRMFTLKDGRWWVGGGVDLTPAYVVNKDVKRFHKKLRLVCEKYDMPYEKFKDDCDKYFSLGHRQGESRGVGGVIFDDLHSQDFDKLLRFLQELLEESLRFYSETIGARRKQSYTEAEKEWQLLRRGRYVEFNLLVDRGTMWGLRMPNLIDPENVLLATPPEAKFLHRHEPSEGTPEAYSLDVFRNPRQWAQ